MKYYHYRPDANNYAGVGLERKNWDVIKIRNKDLPIADTWEPIQVHGFDDSPSAVGDFPSLSDYNELPVMSQRAWDTLRFLIGKFCECLPIIHPSGQPYFLIHVMQIIDALDVIRSEINRSKVDGRINRIHKYAFKEDMLIGTPIFKLPRESGGELLINEEFRKAVEAHDLKGLLFKEITMAE